LFIFGVPSVLATKYALHLQLLFGSLTPQLVILGSLYLAASRYKWLTSSSFIKDGNIARKVSLEDQDTLVIESMQMFSMKQYKLNLNSVQIRYVENELRRETYYLIRDLNSKKTFILPLDDKAVADRKFINWLSTAKRDDAYSITSTLSKGVNLIDLSANKEMQNEIDNFARLNLVTELHPSLDLSTLTPKELHEIINLIPDSQVKEYLERVKNQVESTQPLTIETSLVEVENFLISIGFIREEAINITKHLRKNLKISAVSDLKNLSRNELSESLQSNSSKSNVELDLMLKEIQLFFRKI
jgi:hypothetical protein